MRSPEAAMAADRPRRDVELEGIQAATLQGFQMMVVSAIMEVTT